MSTQSKKDVELVTWHFVREGYESKCNNNVPSALKYVIISFSQKLIRCRMLSFKQDINFYNVLNEHWKTNKEIKGFQLLYTASENKYTPTSFHNHCDGKPNTIVIIKSRSGQLFGGYCSIGWSSHNQYKIDNESFLFLIQSKNRSKDSKHPQIFKLLHHNSPAIYHDGNLGPVFGTGYDIVIRKKCNERLNAKSTYFNSCYSQANSYDIADTNLSGGSRRGSRIFFQ